MKRLLILRHAKSPPAPQLRDFDRPLNDIGRAAAQAMGREMRALATHFDAIAASPARRVVETIEHLAAGLERPLAPRFDPRIYNADAADLLEVVRAGNAASGLLLVGHNPGLAMLARALAADDGSADNQALSAKFPPGALAEITFDVARWVDVEPGNGRLVRFIRPSDLG